MPRFDHNQIASLKAPEKRTELFDDVVKGLGLRLTPKGGKSFFYRYRIHGKTKRFTIGTFPEISLKEARDRARTLKVDVLDGNDPQGERIARRRKEKAELFSGLAEEFKAIHLKPLREKTREEHERIINNVLIPAWGKIPAKEITRSQILSLLDKKAITEGKPTMANRIRARLHSIYEFGIHRGIVEVNPVSGVKAYPEGETKRERYYSEQEIRKLWEAFDQAHQPAGSVMKVLLLTGQRKTETMRMRWSDINGDVWTIPAQLAKGKRSHDVPLSDGVLDVLELMRAVNGNKTFVFNSPVLDDAPVDEIKRSVKNVRDASGVSDFRLHDMRRTAATYMAMLNVDRTVLGKILNHKGLAGDGQVTAIYDRHSYMREKRQALQKWSNHLQRILEGEGAKVHKIG